MLGWVGGVDPSVGLGVGMKLLRDENSLKIGLRAKKLETEYCLGAEFLPKSTPQGRNSAHEKTALEQNSSLKICLENGEQTQWKIMH